MAPKGGLLLPSSEFGHAMRFDNTKESYYNVNFFYKSKQSQHSCKPCQHFLHLQEHSPGTEGAANAEAQTSDLNFLQAKAQAKKQKSSAVADLNSKWPRYVSSNQGDKSLPNSVTKTQALRYDFVKCSNGFKPNLSGSGSLKRRSVFALHGTGWSTAFNSCKSQQDPLNTCETLNQNLNDFHSQSCKSASKYSSPQATLLERESHLDISLANKLCSSDETLSPKHGDILDSVIDPQEKYFKPKKSIRKYTGGPEFSRLKSPYGFFQKSWKTLKSVFYAGSSKDPSDSNNSTVLGDTNKKSHNNRTPKAPSKGKQAKSFDSESTPLFPEKRQPKKSPEEKETKNTMTAKDEGGSRFFVYYLSCFATIGGLLFGYDTGIVSGSMLLIEDYFELTTIWKEFIVSATVGAAAVFALIAGFVCDYLGRKVSIMMASVIFTVGAIVMGAADSKEMLLGGRIIVGIGIGFASMTVPVYIAEAAPSAIRGRLVSLNQLFITIGILVSALVAGAFSSMKETGWRYMLGLAGVPGVIQFIGFLYLPESPRWLVTRGHEEKAREVLRRIRDKEDVEEELREIKVTVEESKKDSGLVVGRVLSTPHVRKALFIGCGLQLFQQLCGINTVIYYSGTILKMAGFPAERAIWLVTIPFSINFLFTILGVWLVERLGRKKLLVGSFIGVTFALVVLAVGFQLSAKFSPAVDHNITEVYDNGTVVVDKCITKNFASCEECIENDDCGFCYTGSGESTGGTCLRADKDEDKEDERSAYGRCGVMGLDTLSTHWAHGYCPTDYTWMAVLGLTLFVMAFAPGLGPMPWTINSEIYPLWARGTGNAIATGCNWIGNLLVSLFFLTLTENITKYGAFWLFCGICFLGLLFTVIFVPETKNKTLEEMEQLFMGTKRNAVGAVNNGYEKEIEAQEATAVEQKEDTQF